MNIVNNVRFRANTHPMKEKLICALANKVPNKETDEYMHGRI